MTRSIRARLIVSLAAAAAIVMTLGAVLTVALTSHFISQRIDARLIETAARATALLTASDTATLSPDLSAILSSDLTGVMALDDGELVHTAQLTGADAELLAAVTSGDPVAVGDYRAVAVSLDAGSLLFESASEDPAPVRHLVLAIDTTAREGIIASITTAAVISVGAALVILILVAVVIVTRGLRPLSTMADRAAALAGGDHTTRLPVGERDDPSIARLATTVNAAFDAQEDAQNRVRSFVADASHELRSPLTTATGWVDLFLQGGVTTRDSLNDAMGRVATQLHRMRQLIEELATLARTDAGRPMDQSPVDLGALTREVVTDMRIAHPARDIRLAPDEAGPALVLGDQARLAQVLRNLVGNAVSHTPADAAITVACSSEGSKHRIQVADTGPGIPAEHLPHVFERFWRADSSRTAATAGFGLGLAIAQSLVEAHGGTITVSSGSAQGTEFVVTLPVLRMSTP